MQFFNLEAQQQNLKNQIDRAVCDVLAHGPYMEQMHYRLL